MKSERKDFGLFFFIEKINTDCDDDERETNKRRKSRS